MATLWPQLVSQKIRRLQRAAKGFGTKEGFIDVKGKTAWGTLEVRLTLAVDYATKGEFNRLRLESRIGTVKRITTCRLRKRERKARWKILGNVLLLLAEKVNEGF